MSTTEAASAPGGSPAGGPVGQPATGAADAGTRRIPRLPEWTAAVAALAGITVLAVVANLWWIAANRRGLPFDIDESGYLQRTIRDADALRGGLGQLVQAVRQPDPQAPLVPVVGGFVRSLTHAGPYKMLGVEQLFTVVLAIATYLAATKAMARRWAVLAAAVVLALPGAIDGGRRFDFVLPAAALVTAALAAQLGAADFASTPRALTWGVLLGLATLTRTMVLGLIPALLIAAVVRLIAVRAGRRQLLNVGGGVVLGFAVALTWYSATWRNVADYLFSYGYGVRAAGYGQGYPVWDPNWWTARLGSAANNEIYFPLSLALGVCAGLGVAGLLARWRAGARAATDPGARRELRRARLAGNPATVAVYVFVGYLALSSTRNHGSGFELTLIPAAVILTLAAASRAGRAAWPVALAVCSVAAVFSLAADSGLVPGSRSATRSVSLGPVGIKVLDSRGPLFRYAQLTFGGCPSLTRCMGGPPPTTDDQYLVRWLTAAHAGAGLIHGDALARDREPVVFFATQDPFFNTNSVDLAYQLGFHQQLPTGLLRPPAQAGLSLVGQLETPRLGQPNLVIVGTPSRVPRPRAFSPVRDPRPVRVALRADGFHQIGHLTLPDGRVMQLWWKERGPAIPTSPVKPSPSAPPGRGAAGGNRSMHPFTGA